MSFSGEFLPFHWQNFKIVSLEAQMELDGLPQHYMNWKLSILSIYEVSGTFWKRQECL